MNVLIDTHALLWWWEKPQQLSATARKTIESDSYRVLVSAAVAWEVAIKTNTGRVHFESFLSRWPELLEAEGFEDLPILSEHGIRAGQLPLHHRDPFDRMLAAQAQAYASAVISIDTIFDTYGVRRIW